MPRMLRRTLVTCSAAAAVLVAVFGAERAPAQTSSQTPAAPAPLDGAMLFKDNCAACHQAEGQGIPGAFPALAGNPFVLGPRRSAAGVVLNGRGGMPAFREELSPPVIAAILTYVRSSWGNAAPPIETAVVEEVAAGGSAPSREKSVLPFH